jgi:hypothetical protein
VFDHNVTNIVQKLRVSEDSRILLSSEVLSNEPDELVMAMKKQQLIKRSQSVSNVTCKGCEQACFMPIYTQIVGKDSESFIVCDERSDINRVAVDRIQMQQWKLTGMQVARLFAQLMGFSEHLKLNSDTNRIRLGMLKSKKGRRCLSLNVKSIELELNTYSIPVEDVLYLEKGSFAIDIEAINQVANKKPQAASSKCYPSPQKQMISKAKTSDRYQQWKDEYKLLKLNYKDKNDTWIANKISKMPIAAGRSAETIRKNMK